MARDTEKDRVKRWSDEIHRANKLYGKWETRWNPKQLEAYYAGKQWRGLNEDEAKNEDEANKRYVINLIYSTIETQKPAMLFSKPKIRVDPKPGRLDSPDSGHMEAQARLQQQTAQTFIDDPNLYFDLEAGLALHEMFFRFGVIEVGYTADWIDNPSAGKPELKPGTDHEPYETGDKQPVLQGARIIQSERLFIKRIPAKDFRVSLTDKNALEMNDWVGYREWHRLDDLKQNPLYKRGAVGLKSTGGVAKDFSLPSSDYEQDEAERYAGMVGIWKIWDIRQHKKHVIADGHEKFLLEGQPYTTLPFAVLKGHETTDSFYPQPLAAQWRDAQDEVNEEREQKRNHRRRFTRRYTTREGVFDTTELEKLESGVDGVYAIHKGAPNEDPLRPVPDAPLDPYKYAEDAKADFIEVSGVSGPQRGIPTADTATEANIIDSHTQLRESATRQKVGSWLAGIARLIILITREKMALPFVIKRYVDPGSPDAPMQALKVADLWQRIQAQDLGDFDMEVSVDLASLSPVTEQEQRAAWTILLEKYLVNPAVMNLFAESESILRKTLTLYGITSEGTIQEIRALAVKMSLMAQLQAQMALLTGGGEAGLAGPTGPQGGNGQPRGPVAGQPSTPAPMAGSAM